MYDLTQAGLRSRAFPPPLDEVIPGVTWGAFDQLYTPAFWAGRAWLSEPILDNFRLGDTLVEELVACLLGGHGMRAEIALAAFARLRAARVPDRLASADEIFSLLATPFDLKERLVRYRFPMRKAQQLSAALRLVAEHSLHDMDDLELRTFLTCLPGVGPKTASWITRNWRGSDAVAILDVHICRACILANVFRPDANPMRDYFGLEQRFLAFANAIDVRTAILDNLMWQTMRRLAPSARRVMREASNNLAHHSSAYSAQRRGTS